MALLSVVCRLSTRCTLALVVSLLCVVANAYVMRPIDLSVVGRAIPGGYLWKPSHPINFGDHSAAFRVSLSPEGCESAVPSLCRHQIVSTVDGGQTFQVSDVDDFCGSAGVLRNQQVLCVQTQSTGGDVSQRTNRWEGDWYVMVFPHHAFELTEAPASTIKMTLSEDPAVFRFPRLVADVSLPQSIRLGDNTLSLSDKSLFLRNAEVVFVNGSKAHVVFKSDNGLVWNWLSVLPFDLGEASSLQRIGDTKIMAMSGVSGHFTQAQSVYLGNRWDKVEVNTFFAPLYSWVAPYYTTLYSGVHGRPGLFAFAMGSKKGTEKPINLAEFHNRIAAKKEITEAINFTSEFLNATSFSCTDPVNSTNFSLGCQSSSFIAMLSVENGTVHVFYDQLNNGFNPAPQEGLGSRVYAMKLLVNETKEKAEYEERVKENLRKYEQERFYEEQRQKAEKEAEQRKKEERRQKVQLEKQRKLQFQALDANFIAEAKKNEEEGDGEFIVVRDIDPEYADIEKKAL